MKPGSLSVEISNTSLFAPPTMIDFIPGEKAIYSFQEPAPKPGLRLNLLKIEQEDSSISMVPESPVMEADPPKTQPIWIKLPGIKKLIKKQDFTLKLSEIEQARGLCHKDVANKRILCLDSTCFTRSIGIIRCAHYLEQALQSPLAKRFDLITGEGFGAILAAGLSLGMSADEIFSWWVTDFKKVMTPGYWAASKKLMVNATRSIRLKRPAANYHYSFRQAIKALEKLFIVKGRVLRLSNCQTRLRLSSWTAENNSFMYDSASQPELSIIDVLKDCALSPRLFDVSTQIEGESIPLGDTAPNNILDLALADNTTGMSLISIGCPPRRVFYGKSLDYASHEELSHIYHVNHYFKQLKNTEAAVKKLRIKYKRLECDPIDGVLENSTSHLAIKAAMDSASKFSLNPNQLLMR